MKFHLLTILVVPWSLATGFSPSSLPPLSLLSSPSSSLSPLRPSQFQPVLRRTGTARWSEVTLTPPPPPSNNKEQATSASFLPEETLQRAAKGNPTEKLKLRKDPMSIYTDITEYAKNIREGTTTWDEIDNDDYESRMKWLGMLSRRKRAPGTFMMRLKVPNGIVNSDQLRFYADCVEPYGPEVGVIDITTRQNIQMRGVTVEDAPAIFEGLHARNQTSFMSALDNVRNLVGSPLAGIDDQELVDTRMLCRAVEDMVTIDESTGQRGNPKFSNLPRKFNIAISGSRDDFSHTHINDIGLQPVAHHETGEMGFNVVLGGYMSIKRVAESLHTDMWIPADRASVVTLCEAILRIFRDEGGRKDRQKARLIWLVEEYGVPEFVAAVRKEMDSYGREGVRHGTAQSLPGPEEVFERRELLGVHEQKQSGLVRIGVLVPVGRISVVEARELADLADKYSAGEMRLTVEQNAIFPNVDEARVAEFHAEPCFNKAGARLNSSPGNIEGHTVSCTGSQFCGLGMVETKINAERISRLLEERVTVPKKVRIHWTGCPNSCGQVQCADIGLMGSPAKKFNEETQKNMAVPGVKIFVGGTIGEWGKLSMDPVKTIIMEDEIVLEELVGICVEKFGGVRKTPVPA